MRLVPILFILLFLFNGAVLGEQETVASISGKVVDEKGIPLSDIKIVLQHFTEKSIKIPPVTDKKGLWSVKLPLKGEWVLKIEKESFITYVKVLKIVKGSVVKEKSVLSKVPDTKLRDLRKDINRKKWKQAIDKANILLNAYLFSEEKKIVENTLYWLAYAQSNLGNINKDSAKRKELKINAINNLNYLLDVISADSKWLDDTMILRTRLGEELFRKGERKYLKLIREAENYQGKNGIVIRMVALEALLKNGLVSPDPLMIIVESNEKNSVRIMAVKILTKNVNRRIWYFLNRIYRDNRTPAIVRLAVKQALEKIKRQAFRLDQY